MGVTTPNEVKVIDLADGPIRAASDTPAVHVLATTQDGTRAAVESAGRFARRFGTRVVLLVPNVTSDNTPLETIAAERAFAARFETLSASWQPNLALVICVCRKPDDIFAALLDENALTFIGGRAGLWWPSPEQRLTRRMTARGHHVVFVNSG